MTLDANMKYKFTRPLKYEVDGTVGMPDKGGWCFTDQKRPGAMSRIAGYVRPADGGWQARPNAAEAGFWGPTKPSREAAIVAIFDKHAECVAAIKVRRDAEQAEQDRKHAEWVQNFERFKALGDAAVITKDDLVFVMRYVRVSVANSYGEHAEFTKAYDKIVANTAANQTLVQ